MEEITFSPEEIIAAVDIVLSILILILSGILFFVIKRFFTKKARPKKSKTDTDYVREVPDGWTPAEMCPLYYYFDKKNIYIDESMSATILDLARKGYLEIFDDGDDKTPTELKLKNLDKTNLKVHEGILLSLLENVAPLNQVFDMEDFEKYLKANQEYAAKQIDEYRKASEKLGKDLNLYMTNDPKQKKVLSIGAALFILAIALLYFDNVFFELGVALFSEIALGILGFLLSAAASVSNRLTEKGQHWYLYFHKLSSYMIDFSSLDEHDVDALKLWDEYMVYATAMGIAEKVSKNMQIAYPNLQEEKKKKAALYSVSISSPRLVTNSILHGTRVISYAAANVIGRSVGASIAKNFGFSSSAMRKVNRIDVAGKLFKSVGNLFNKRGR